MHQRRDYHYELHPAQIAPVPADRRDGSRLMCLEHHDDRRHSQFADLIDRLPEGSVLVANDARVRRARIRAHKRATGGAVELLLIEPAGLQQQWRALARSSKPLREGAVLETSSGDAIEVVRGRAADGSVVVQLPVDADRLCAAAGELPLPPYIERPSGPLAADSDRYQTVYAQTPGAIAAPTAGLHFTPQLIETLRARGHQWTTLTLDVGLGTFAPVRSEQIEDHSLHTERYRISVETADAVASGRPVVAIGTTVVRALESAYILGDGRVEPGEQVADLFIRPGHHFGVVSHLVTNFHLPESSLLMLVAAFAGHGPTMAAYREAVARGYRFFSYGDAMFARCNRHGETAS